MHQIGFTVTNPVSLLEFFEFGKYTCNVNKNKKFEHPPNTYEILRLCASNFDQIDKKCQDHVKELPKPKEVQGSETDDDYKENPDRYLEVIVERSFQSLSQEMIEPLLRAINTFKYVS